ncbi:hypothetical protein HDV05_000320 [Chytridiales sp. JEL 0842]|nr:hypothetical protein HDV05_000320 [Chytridiales sp. JEL 0842]
MKFTQVASVAFISAAAAVQATQITDLIKSAVIISHPQLASRSLFARQDAGNATETTTSVAEDLATATRTTSSPSASATGTPAAGSCEACAAQVVATSDKCVESALTAASSGDLSSLFSQSAAAVDCICDDLRSTLSCAASITGNCPVTSTNPLSGPSTDLQTIKTQTEDVCKPGPNGKSCADVQKSSLDKLTPCLKTALSNPQESDKCACGAIGGIASEFRASCDIPSLNIESNLRQLDTLKAQCAARGYSAGVKSSSVTGAMSILSVAAALLL